MPPGLPIGRACPCRPPAITLEVRRQLRYGSASRCMCMAARAVRERAMNCLVRWGSVVAIAALVPILWLLGNVSAQGLSMLAAPRYDTLADDGRWLLIIGASMLVSSLVVGFVVAWCARAVGHASIRTLLAPSRAQTFGVLTAILLWLSLTGLYWASCKQDDLLTAFWYIALGA